MDNDQFINMSKEILIRRLELSRKDSDSLRARLIWYAAIAAFVLINSWSLIEDQVISNTYETSLLVFSIPWIIAVFFAVLGNYLSGRANEATTKYYEKIIPTFDLFAFSLSSEEKDFKEVNNQFQESISAHSPEKEDVINKTNCVKTIETVAFLFILFGLIWSFTIPFLF